MALLVHDDDNAVAAADDDDDDDDGIDDLVIFVSLSWHSTSKS